MDEQLKKDVETVQRAAGRQPGRVVQGDIVTHALPIDPSLEDAKAFVSGIHSSAGNPQPQKGYGTVEPPGGIAHGYGPQQAPWGPVIGGPTEAELNAFKSTGEAPWQAGGKAGEGESVGLDADWPREPAQEPAEETHSCCGTPIYTPHTPTCPRFGVEYDAVNPPHYQRGPVVKGDIGSNITKGIGAWTYAIKCIDVMRAIKDPRLATAFKYIWRVAFGGKCEPGMEQATQRERDERDINSAVWYLQDWLNHEV